MVIDRLRSLDAKLWRFREEPELDEGRNNNTNVLADVLLLNTIETKNFSRHADLFFQTGQLWVGRLQFRREPCDPTCFR